jgi:hypothetical protein
VAKHVGVDGVLPRLLHHAVQLLHLFQHRLEDAAAGILKLLLAGCVFLECVRETTGVRGRGGLAGAV